MFRITHILSAFLCVSHFAQKLRRKMHLFFCLHSCVQLVAWHDTLKSELGVVDSSSNLSGRKSVNGDDDSENYFASNSGFDIGHFVPPSILPSVYCDAGDFAVYHLLYVVPCYLNSGKKNVHRFLCVGRERLTVQWRHAHHQIFTGS
jgi:hypothetical protein